MLHKGEIEWHDLRIDPDDLPGNGDPILVTIDCIDTITCGGDRAVWLDVTLQDDESGDGYQWVTRDASGKNCALYYKVIAWAYPPDPYVV